MTARVDAIVGVADRIAADATAMEQGIGEVSLLAQDSRASTEQVSASTEQTSASTQEIAASAAVAQRHREGTRADRRAVQARVNARLRPDDRGGAEGLA